MLKRILVDFDDTFVETAKFFMEAHNRFITLLENKGVPQERLPTVKKIQAVEKTVNIVDGYAPGNLFRIYSKVARDHAREFIDADLLDDIEDITEFVRNHPRPRFSDAQEFFERMHKAGVEVDIFTMGIPTHQRQKLEPFLEALGPARCAIRKIKIVAYKTSDYYEEYLEDNDLKPEEVMMMGDSIPSDINPSRSLGMTALHVDRSEKRKLKSDFDAVTPVSRRSGSDGNVVPLRLGRLLRAPDLIKASNIVIREWRKGREPVRQINQQFGLTG